MGKAEPFVMKAGALARWREGKARRELSNTHERSQVDFLMKLTRQAEVGSWFLWK